MASQSAQTKAQALNMKLESAARETIDDIDKHHLRKVARQAFSCALACYDKAGTSGSSEVLDQCTTNCQTPHRQKQQYVQQVRAKQGGGVRQTCVVVDTMRLSSLTRFLALHIYHTPGN